MGEPEIRRATVADVSALARLRRADATERLSMGPGVDPGFEERFAEWFSASDGDAGVTWIATDDGPAGMLQLFLHDRMPAPDRDTGGWG